MGTQAVRREVSAKAWVACLRMQAVCLPDDERVTEQPDRALWLAYMDGEPCGFIVVQDLLDATCYVELVGVMPAARGYRLQTRLTATALRYFRKHGCKTAISYTACWNHASSNNFVASGWRLYDPATRWGWADALYWRKSL